MKTHRMNIAVPFELYEELLRLEKEGLGFNWSKVAGRALELEIEKIRAEYRQMLLETGLDG